MPGEILTIQAGQCGNQIGEQYWNQLSLEHGILADGSSLPFPQNNADSSFSRDDQPDIFFNHLDDNKYIPRSILIDLEPSVINSILSRNSKFNPRNVHLAGSGAGAGNNWVNGYQYGQNNQQDLLDILDRELDKCDNLQSFQIIHSIAGGTGSGVGSFMLELINDRYSSKKFINNFSVFPNSSNDTSDVVVQPYNSILTLRRLIEFSDCCFIFDNGAVNEVASSVLNSANISFDDLNHLISIAMSNISNPLRFPSYMYNSMESILSTLIPTPDLKFLSTSFTPFTGDLSAKFDSSNKINLNEYAIILELLNNKLKMNQTSKNHSVKYISILDYLIGGNLGGGLNQYEIRKGIIKAQQRVEFVPWSSSSIHLNYCTKSPFLIHNSNSNTNSTSNNILSSKFKRKDINGLMISNNTSVVEVLQKNLKQFEKLINKKAFLRNFIGQNQNEKDILDELNDCRESVQGVIKEYENCQHMSYLEDEEDI